MNQESGIMNQEKILILNSWFLILKIRPIIFV